MRTVSLLLALSGTGCFDTPSPPTHPGDSGERDLSGNDLGAWSSDAGCTGGSCGWPVVGHDVMRSGQSDVSVPTLPVLKWSFAFPAPQAVSCTYPYYCLGGYGAASPVVGADGTVYVGSTKTGLLYALDGS